MKTLYLVRHAKSSWKDVSLPDDQRPLNKRGKKNAPAMGDYLAQMNVKVDRIVSSPANRALTTAGMIATALDFDSAQIIQEPSLYFSGIDAMIETVQSTGEQINSLMLVGHNPDITYCVNALCGHQVDNMPTCAVATITFEGEWQGVRRDTGRLLDLKIPREL